MGAAMPPRNGSGGGGELNLRAWALEAEAAAGIARSLVGTPWVPEAIKVWQNPRERDPDKKVLDMDGTIATIAAVLLAGAELGLKPMASLRSFTIIKGTVAMYALAARGILLNAGHEIVVVESTSTRAIVRGRRADGDWQQSTWDMDRARTAGLFPGHPEGNWRKNPKAMLVARATAEASRWVAADALLGIPVMAEELEDGDATPVLAIEGPQADNGDAAPAKATRTTKRRTTPAPRALPAAAAPPPPDPQPDPGPDPPATVRPRLTPAARTKILAMLKQVGVTGKDDSLSLLNAWLPDREGGPVQATSELTPNEAADIIEKLTALATIAKPAAPAAEPPPEEGPPPDAEPDDR